MNQAIETLKLSLQAQESNASIHLLQGDIDQANACAAKAGDLRAAIEILEERNQPTTVSAAPPPEPAKTERELHLEKQLASALEEVVERKRIDERRIAKLMDTQRKLDQITAERDRVCNTVNEISEGRRVQLDRLRDFAGMQSAGDEDIVSQVIKHIEALRKNNDSLFEENRKLVAFAPLEALHTMIDDPTPAPDDETPSAAEIRKCRDGRRMR